MMFLKRLLDMYPGTSKILIQLVVLTNLEFVTQMVFEYIKY